jgi:putative nucleotidyltransferase with HDIG domain
MVEENSQPIIEEEKKDLSFLLDSSYPLLKEFRDKCPGTFKHSQTVSSMAEAVTSALGGDVLLMKIAAMYHDVGKMRNSKYFTENQLEDENLHEKLDPRISFQIISRHIADTALILINDNNFPRELIQIATQHHGTSVIKYFYQKYQAQNENAVEDFFRYPGEKPQSVEAMVLMLCDNIEAMSRSQVQSGKFDPARVIMDTWELLESDRQFEDVVMRLGHVVTIKETLAKELEGMYQKRVDYDKAKDEGKSNGQEEKS